MKIKKVKIFTYSIRLIALLFILSPIIVVTLYSFSLEPTSVLPIKGLTLKWYMIFLSKNQFIDSLGMSLLLGVFATAVSLPIGILAAYAIARYEFKGREFLNVFFLSPVLVPGVLMGISLIMYFNSVGIYNSFTRLIIAHTIITLPYVIRGMLPGFYTFDRSVEEAAMNLGADPVKTFFSVTLPIIKPSIVASTIFAFAQSFGNLSITIFLADPKTYTLPIQVFSWLYMQQNPTIAAGSTLIILMTIALILITDRIVGLDKAIEGMIAR